MEQQKKAKNKTLRIFSNTILLLNKLAVFDYVMYKLRQCGSNTPEPTDLNMHVMKSSPSHGGTTSISAIHQSHMQSFHTHTNTKKKIALYTNYILNICSVRSICI